MSKNNYLLTVLLLLAFLAGACNYPGYSSAPVQRPVGSITPSPDESGSNPIQLNPDCASGLIPGEWTGSVSSSTTASSMGFRVINQSASISLKLDVNCAGDITGSASREGSGEIRVPFMLDGTCIEDATYQVSGVILSENPTQTILRLTFNTVEGRLSCNLNSSVSTIPGGEQVKDLAGSSFTVDLIPESLNSMQISGSQWPDTIYHDQFAGTQDGMDEYDITTQTVSSWVLTFQK